MTKKQQRQELVRLEKQILKTARYVEGHGLVEPMSAWDGTTREEVAELLKERQARRKEMCLCTEQEVSTLCQMPSNSASTRLGCSSGRSSPSRVWPGEID